MGSVSYPHLKPLAGSLPAFLPIARCSTVHDIPCHTLPDITWHCIEDRLTLAAAANVCYVGPQAGQDILYSRAAVFLRFCPSCPSPSSPHIPRRRRILHRLISHHRRHHHSHRPRLQEKPEHSRFVHVRSSCCGAVLRGLISDRGRPLL